LSALSKDRMGRIQPKGRNLHGSPAAIGDGAYL
jgi:hypothetical protein